MVKRVMMRFRIDSVISFTILLLMLVLMLILMLIKLRRIVIVGSHVDHWMLLIVHLNCFSHAKQLLTDTSNQFAVCVPEGLAQEW